MPTLAEEIASETDTLCLQYPKGMAMTDVAGYFGAPLKDVQRAIDRLRSDGAALPFLKDGPRPREPWQPRETHTINSQIGEREGPHPNKRGRTQPELMADELRYRLTELAKPYPQGATVQQFKDFFAIERLDHAYAVISTLEVEGDIITTRSLDQSRSKTVYVRGMREPPPPLTELQDRVYHHILKVAGGANGVTVNYFHTARAIDASPGSVPQVCYALERKGYIRRLTPYGYGGDQAEPGGEINGQRSPEYEICKLALKDPFEGSPPKPARNMPSHPRIPPAIRDEAAVKRAIARRAELVREIERIDAFLKAFSEFAK